MTTFLIALALLLPTHHPDIRTATVRPYDAKLERMAMCESTKRWWIVTKVRDSRGRIVYFYGGLQFDLSTWRSVGGKGYPHQATELEQKYRAVKLIKRRGYQPWPVCGSA
jgi:hypothetical protein